MKRPTNDKRRANTMAPAHPTSANKGLLSISGPPLSALSSSLPSDRLAPSRDSIAPKPFYFSCLPPPPAPRGLLMPSKIHIAPSAIRTSHIYPPLHLYRGVIDTLFLNIADGVCREMLSMFLYRTDLKMNGQLKIITTKIFVESRKGLINIGLFACGSAVILNSKSGGALGSFGVKKR